MKRKKIKKVLMCRPLYFSTLDYVINPWMKPGTIDQDTAMKQWETLVQAYKDLGIKVEIIDQQKGWPDMVFATDEGLVTGKKLLLSRFRYKERQGETPYYKEWFEKQGYEISTLPEHFYFEGNGTMYFWNDKLFVGVGYRVDRPMCRYLQTLFPDYEVIPLEVASPSFYHLDMGFFPLNDDSIFYYPEAYSPDSRNVLKKMVPNLITLSEQEMKGYCANSVVVGKHVVHQSDNPTFNKKLTSLGYKNVDVNVSEFKKSGGGIHCLTNILE
jgi:N-dimethylarginine dimethylaminohydrolase